MTAADDYTLLMRQLREALPDLARQVEQTVREGKYARQGREAATTDSPELEPADVKVLPYSDEERIELIRNALLTLAETMWATRQAVWSMMAGPSADPDLEWVLQFRDPQSGESSSLVMPEEMDRSRTALQAARELLGDRFGSGWRPLDEQG